MVIDVCGRAMRAPVLLGSLGLPARWAELLPVPATVSVRSYRADWSPTLGLSYAAVIDRDAPLGGERGQPPRWFDLDEKWESTFPQDRDRLRAHVHRLAVEHSVADR